MRIVHIYEHDCSLGIIQDYSLYFYIILDRFFYPSFEEVTAGLDDMTALWTIVNFSQNYAPKCFDAVVSTLNYKSFSTTEATLSLRMSHQILEVKETDG